MERGWGRCGDMISYVKILHGLQQSLPLTMITLLTLIIINIHQVKPSIQLKNITVIPHPQVAQSVELKCDYDLAGEPLYSLKWYKDNTEFYRWMPRETPQTLTFPVAGTHVSLTESHHRNVKLLNISLASSGLYQCEVSTEAPKFKTVAADAVMSVVKPPSEGPRLHWINIGEKLRARREELYRVSPGERIVMHCTSRGSVPAASIKFYINDEIANNKNVETVNHHSNREDVLKTSKKELDIVLERRHFRYGNLEIKCTSSIYNVYFQSNQITFVGSDLGEMALGRQTINFGISSFISLDLLMVSLLVSLLST